MHLFGFHIYFTYIEDARSNTNQVHTFSRFIAQCLNRLCHRVPSRICRYFILIYQLRYVTELGYINLLRVLRLDVLISNFEQRICGFLKGFLTFLRRIEGLKLSKVKNALCNISAMFLRDFLT
jgi:hypothetical protein